MAVVCMHTCNSSKGSAVFVVLVFSFLLLSCSSILLSEKKKTFLSREEYLFYTLQVVVDFLWAVLTAVLKKSM